MSSFTDRYSDVYDIDRFILIKDKLIYKTIIYAQGDSSLDTQDNVFIAIKSMPDEAYDLIK